MTAKPLRLALFVVLLLLAFAAALSGFALTLRAVDAEPILLSSSGEPEDTARAFLDTLCAGDYAAAAEYCVGGLPSEQTPQEGEEAELYAAMKASWAWERVGEAEKNGIYAALPVEISALDVAALSEGMNDEVNALLARYVDEAERVADVYDESGSYRSEVVARVWDEVWHGRLARAEEFVRSAETVLTLRYTEEGWRVLVSDELLNLLSGAF